ncbi:MAG: YqaJ viral recombinase family protein [Oxalobacter formigenes]|nr:YqaJ viral recombinase family protein [Oxalobacter formigenes]
MTHSDFLAARQTGIGGSDIGPILGLSPFRTAYDVFLDKTQPEEREETDAMYWGTILEDVVAAEYQKRSGRKVQRVPHLLRHPEHDFAIANIDRAVIVPEIAGNVRWKNGRLTTDRILECKTANAYVAGEWGDPGTDSVPDTYILQCQWYMGVTGTKVSDLAVLIGGNDYRMFTIERDDALIADLLAEAETFWNNCKKGIAPDPRSTEELARKFPRHIAGKSVSVDFSIAHACERLSDIKTRIKRMEEEADDFRMIILQAIGDAEAITFEGKTIATWKTRKATRLDTKRLKEEQPEMVARYIKETESRVLSLKQN